MEESYAGPAADERYSFPEELSDSLIRINRELYCLQTAIVNVYFCGTPSSWVLVDTGFSFSYNPIVQTARTLFGNRPPRAIILTHGHFDHVGSAARLARKWECPIFAHPLGLPFLTGSQSYPPADPLAGGGMMSYLSLVFPRGPSDLRGAIFSLPDDGHVPGVEGWEWMHTPGHSPGHVSLYQPQTGTLIAGDAFVTTREESLFAALAQPECVWRPPGYFTPDWAAAWESVAMLAALKPEVAVTGHGRPIYGEALRRGLSDLADNFLDVIPPGRLAMQRMSAMSPMGVVLGSAAALALGLLLAKSVGSKKQATRSAGWYS